MTEEHKRIADKIYIPHADDVRGNITLPENIDGASITYISSRPDVVTDKDMGPKKAGVVTRGQTDIDLTITAVITKDNKSVKKDIHLCVKKAPKEISEDDYAGYLFGHFIG